MAMWLLWSATTGSDKSYQIIIMLDGRWGKQFLKVGGPGVQTQRVSRCMLDQPAWSTPRRRSVPCIFVTLDESGYACPLKKYGLQWWWVEGSLSLLGTVPRPGAVVCVCVCVWVCPTKKSNEVV